MERKALKTRSNLINRNILPALKTAMYGTLESRSIQPHLINLSLLSARKNLTKKSIRKMMHIPLSIVIKTLEISIGSTRNVSINNAINTYIDNTIINISKNPMRFCSVWFIYFIVAVVFSSLRNTSFLFHLSK